MSRTKRSAMRRQDHLECEGYQFVLDEFFLVVTPLKRSAYYLLTDDVSAYVHGERMDVEQDRPFIDNMPEDVRHVLIAWATHQGYIHASRED